MCVLQCVLQCVLYHDSVLHYDDVCHYTLFLVRMSDVELTVCCIVMVCVSSGVVCSTHQV